MVNVLYRIHGRFYNLDNELLYVGKSTTAAARIAQHHRGKDWWSDVTDISLQHFDTEETLAVAEIDAIKAERPRYNIQHNDYRRPRWFLEELATLCRHGINETTMARADHITDLINALTHNPDGVLATTSYLGNPQGRSWCDVCARDSTTALLHGIDRGRWTMCAQCLALLMRRAEIKRLQATR